MAFLPKFSSPPLLPLQKPSQRLILSPTARTNLDFPPPLPSRRDAVRERPPSLPHKPLTTTTTTGDRNGNGNKDDFYLNLGVAVRTLRNDLPSLFSKDLNYDIYRSTGRKKMREKKNLESRCSSLALSIARGRRIAHAIRCPWVKNRPRDPSPAGDFFVGRRFLLPVREEETSPCVGRMRRRRQRSRAVATHGSRALFPPHEETERLPARGERSR
ncbi:hypothetical protein GW17_00035832 [Ensete ventricosum]|nr:hypothetical protein GW17_00035832 [Ensete ventricosum]